MKPFEIFKTGTHTSSQGATLTFGDAEVAAIASGYDKGLHHAPIVVGHPKQDAPAYGWVDALAVKGDRLIATPASIDTAFADLVREGKFTARSAAFYRPDDPNNPTPGAYYLRHVGFLGAAAPAVKGLKPLQFAGDDTLIVEFADTEYADWRQSWAIGAAARLFRGLRDWLIETKDLETANRVLPEWEVGQLTETAAEMRVEDQTSKGLAYADPGTTTAKKEPDMTEQERRAAELAEREGRIAAREASFAEQERRTRATEDAATVDAVVKAGRLPIGLQATATALFADLGDGELTFAEGTETRKTTPRAAFRSLLEQLPVPVVTGELAKGDGPDFSDPLQVASAITSEIRSAADKGETISGAEAVRRLNIGSSK